VLETLRIIGSTLLAEIGGARHTEEALARGAAGDRTFAVDRRAEEIILSGLEALGEPLTVISEEAGVVEMRGGGETTVLIDPIDGSKNAVTGIPFYCSTVAVARGKRLGDVTLSYTVNLVSGEAFWAERGGGACRNGKRLATRRDDVMGLAIYEAQAPGRDIARALPLLSAFRRTRCFGAMALDLAYLAAGSASVFVSPGPARSFDFAGGLLMVLEAGGVMTDLRGKGLDGIELGLERASPLLASCNEKVHEKALRLLG